MSDPIVITEEENAPLVVFAGAQLPIALEQPAGTVALLARGVSGDPGAVLVTEARTLVVLAAAGATVATVDAPEIPPVLVGIQGPAGPAGGGGPGAPLEFDFTDPADTWVCQHNLGRRPQIAVYDLDGNLRPLVPVASPDENTTVLTPNPPLAGKAVIS